MKNKKMIREDIKEIDGKIINSIFNLKADYVSEVTDPTSYEVKKLKFIYEALNDHLIVLGDYDGIYVKYQEV